jgi:hypothetical protein
MIQQTQRSHDTLYGDGGVVDRWWRGPVAHREQQTARHVGARSEHRTLRYCGFVIGSRVFCWLFEGKMLVANTHTDAFRSQFGLSD